MLFKVFSDLRIHWLVALGLIIPYDATGKLILLERSISLGSSVDIFITLVTLFFTFQSEENFLTNFHVKFQVFL